MEDPEIKELLKSTLSLAEENNKLLHKIRGVQKRATLLQWLKIIVIAGIALGALYYVEPYLEKVMDLYNSVSGVEQSLKDVSGSTSDLQNLLKKI